MIYVTSDIHGYPLDEFQKLLDKVGFNEDDFLYILGDVIDRGRDGIKILKWIMKQSNIKLLLGNHEEMLLANSYIFEASADDFINELTGSKLKTYITWLSNSAQPTISALAPMRITQIKYILEYLQKSPLYESLTVNGRNFILTHAGLGNFSPDKNPEDYTRHELLWNRPQITDKYFDNVTTVFGHTPTVYFGDEYKGKILTTETWIDVDVGVALGMKPALLRLDDMNEFYL